VDRFEIAAPNTLSSHVFDSDFPWIDAVLSTPSEPALILSLVPVAWGGREASALAATGMGFERGQGPG